MERLEGASVGLEVSRPCIYQTRSYLCACMCGMKKCRVAELRICGVEIVEIGPFVDCKLDVDFLA